VGRPNKRLQILGIVGALALVVAVCLLVPGAGEGGDKKPKAETKKTDGPDPRQQTFTPQTKLPVKLENGIGHLGDRNAKVKVEVFFPGHSGCGSETADFAHRLYLANKEKVHVVFVDFESPGGGAYQGKAGMHCSGVAINGKQSWKVNTDSAKPKTVELGSNLGDRWGEDDFLKAMDVAFKQAYGQPANHKLPPSKSSTKPHSPGAGPGMPTGGGKA